MLFNAGGQPSGGPREVARQSMTLMSAPVSPPFARKPGIVGVDTSSIRGGVIFLR